MARGRRERTDKRRGAVLGWVLIVLLLAALAAGGFAVYRAAAYWRNKVIQNAAALTVPAAVIQPAPAPAQEPPKAETLGALTPEPQPEPQPEPDPEPSRVTLMAVGDNLIHNCVYWSAELPGGEYDFTPFYADIRPTVESYDIACINQETIYVEDPAQYSNYPYFGSPTAVGDALAETGFDVVTAATNHCFDKGETGILDTIRFWRDKHPDMTVLGIHDTPEDVESIRVVEKNGIRIAMLNYTYGLNYGAPQKKYMVDTLSGRDAIADEIGRAREQSDFVIVFAHWGEEGMYVPSADQKSWAQFFADHGVGLVIGAHPHVVQPLETVTAADGAQMPVFYSLGNFLSHQVDPQNMLGGLASVTLEKSPEGAVRVAECTLEPTINVMLYRGEHGRFDYRPMLLTDYTDELAARHHIPGCGVEQMWALFRQITGER